MQIKDLETNKQLHVIGLGLTPAEARELQGDLERLLTDGGDHLHVSSADYQTELTVWISDE